ncbi:hypothetical protein CH254_04500 [Rhodococcus sp. 06-412-2C]|uniref:DUF6527 family protein n=1 Tax=unclassified Rhodococcus (in: high G+C Gram-positive bacteria) TaxID=192944 RepID=UPI000B9A731A|nr:MULTISPECIES: DUF6527 family protein [unclassified Rhodococcus (in: high G+C Gram-positive bacteria)]OZC91744.1 hypothetical protein CH254_04500 [Rhodococcus sp. 06-412-2C]OZC92312.1 hypothetical protein CH279_25775 [Rhodococcus sp. 06-412-2B]
MTPIDHFVLELVESFPTPMELGVLYVSTVYSTAGHICPCGCGREVITKLSPARYRIIFDGEVSLKPSVAATGLPCNSHYFITRGRVDWHEKLSAAKAARVQASDQRSVEDRRMPAQPEAHLLSRLWKRLKGN